MVPVSALCFGVLLRWRAGDGSGVIVLFLCCSGDTSCVMAPCTAPQRGGHPRLGTKENVQSVRVRRNHGMKQGVYRVFSQVFVVLFRQSTGRQRHPALISLREIGCSLSLIRCELENVGKQKVWYVEQAILNLFFLA